jgi:hypothetical protein
MSILFAGCSPINKPRRNLKPGLSAADRGFQGRTRERNSVSSQDGLDGS